MQGNITECVFGRWQLGINDPYLTSWIMVAIYLAVAGLAVAVVRWGSFPIQTRTRERVFWGVLAGVLFLLAFNKQADLQSLVLSIGHCATQSDNMYEFKQGIKGVAMVAIALSFAGIGTVLLWALRRTFRRTGLPLLGLLIIFLFVLSRAFWIFHFIHSIEVAQFIYPLLGSGWPSRFFELSGPLLISLAAVSLLIPRFRAGSDVAPRSASPEP